MEHLGSGKAELWPFDPCAKQPKMAYKDGYQRGYFVLDSFSEGAHQLQKFCKGMEFRSEI